MSWILLLYGLPAKKGAERLKLWRELKRAGALPLKTSAYILPDQPDHHERLQWLAQQVRDSGGEASLMHVTEIEGLSDDEIVRQFNDARASDYSELLSTLTEVIGKNKKRRDDSFEAELERARKRYEEIRKIDFFLSPRGQDVEMLLRRAASASGKRTTPFPLLSTKRFLGKTWLTRPRPEIDRVGSAWLISKVIDQKAKFIFSSEPKAHPDAIPFDMVDVEFSHHGEDCTFETFVKRFGVGDKAFLKIAEMVHDADLEDGKFQTTECFGIDRVLKGWAKSGMSDGELLVNGGKCFDGLYQLLKK